MNYIKEGKTNHDDESLRMDKHRFVKQEGIYGKENSN
jgi:hypothetical protein